MIRRRILDGEESLHTAANFEGAVDLKELLAFARAWGKRNGVTTKRRDRSGQVTPRKSEPMKIQPQPRPPGVPDDHPLVIGGVYQ